MRDTRAKEFFKNLYNGNKPGGSYAQSGEICGTNWKFIEHIQSTSDTEIRISISLDKTIPELFYNQLIEELKRQHVDTAIKSLKESKIILICE